MDMLKKKFQLTCMLIMLGLGSVFAETSSDGTFVTEASGDGYFTISSYIKATLVIHIFSMQELSVR